MIAVTKEAHRLLTAAAALSAVLTAAVIATWGIAKRSSAVEAQGETADRILNAVGELNEAVVRQSSTVEAQEGMIDRILNTVDRQNEKFSLLTSCIVELVAEREHIRNRDGALVVPPGCEKIVATVQIVANSDGKQ